ncbi:hypothetical protein ACFXDH_10190 [Streptomyces sp. NPDC059467]|uniref:hypothetical protein n=1 Tax=Streptomyces sp. NPDC059467 TaxID=3346844 RepID=UPI0036CBC835
MADHSFVRLEWCAATVVTGRNTVQGPMRSMRLHSATAAPLASSRHDPALSAPDLAPASGERPVAVSARAPAVPTLDPDPGADRVALTADQGFQPYVLVHTWFMAPVVDCWSWP